MNKWCVNMAFMTLVLLFLSTAKEKTKDKNPTYTKPCKKHIRVKLCIYHQLHTHTNGKYYILILQQLNQLCIPLSKSTISNDLCSSRVKWTDEMIREKNQLLKTGSTPQFLQIFSTGVPLQRRKCVLCLCAHLSKCMCACMYVQVWECVQVHVCVPVYTQQTTNLCPYDMPPATHTIALRMERKWKHASWARV